MDRSCISPTYIKTEGRMVFAPCMKCNFCLQRYANDWAIRLHHHLKANLNGYFLTLTYDQDHVPLVDHKYRKFKVATVRRTDLAQFHKLVKQYQRRLLTKLWRREGWTEDIIHLSLHTIYNITYFGVPEYGTQTERPHYHTLLFNIHPKVIRDIVARGKVWKHGHIHLGNIADASIMYTTKYVIDRWDTNEHEARERPRPMMSKGLGATYLTPQMIAWHREDARMYTVYNGIKKGLPRYYKKKIYTKKFGYRMAEQFQALQAQRYEEEIQALSLIHPEPALYREAIRIQAYEKIKRKSTKHKSTSL